VVADKHFVVSAAYGAAQSVFTACLVGESSPYDFQVAVLVVGTRQALPLTADHMRGFWPPGLCVLVSHQIARGLVEGSFAPGAADGVDRVADIRGLVTAAFFDVEGRLPAGRGVKLDAIEPFLVADELDVVVVGGVSDLQAFDDQPWYQLAQLVE
jgi:hypothetical protein